MPASGLSVERLQHLALITAAPAAVVLGYVVATRGLRATAAVVLLVAGAALLVFAINRLDTALIPVALVLPLAGYLIVLWPAAGFSLIFDILALVPFAALVMRWLVRPHEVDLLSGPQILVWAFMLTAALQLLNPDGTGVFAGLYGMRRLIVPMLLFFVAFHLDVTAPGRLRRIAWALVVTGWIPLVWGLKQHFVGLTAAEEHYAKEIASGWVGDEVRIFATFAAPWPLATYAGGLALITFALAVASRTPLLRMVALVVSAMAGAALVFTYVRSCLVGYLAGMLFLVLTLLGRRFGTRRVMCAFLAVFAGYVVFALTLGPLIVDDIAGESPAARRAVTILAPAEQFALQARLVAWSEILAIAMRFPLGTGLGSSAGLAARVQPGIGSAEIHPDNMILGVLLEMGWIGAILFIAIVLHVLVRGLGLRAVTLTSRDEWVLRGGTAYLLMMAVASLATPVVFEPTAGQLYWLASGIVARQGVLATMAHRVHETRRH
jgi:hypothetical protein